MHRSKYKLGDIMCDYIPTPIRSNIFKISIIVILITVHQFLWERKFFIVIIC